MQETDRANGKSALQQEMNLARRACWSGNNTTTQKQTKRKYTSNKNTTQSCENEEDDELELKVMATRTSTSTMRMTDGANFSKNFSKFEKTENYKTIEGDEPANAVRQMNPKLKQLADSLSVNNLKNSWKTQTQVPSSVVNNNYDSKNSIIFKTNINNKYHAKINRDKSDAKQLINSIVNGNVNKCNLSLTQNDDDDNADDNFANATTAAPSYDFRFQILRFWLAFVAFCDSITIKHDDPRFAEARRRDNEARKDSVMPSKFKLITSKKLIFLFVVCIFFSFLNRIDARPNTSAFNNLLTDASATGTGMSSDGVTSNSPESAKLTLLADPTESVMKAGPPPEPNVISKQHIIDEKPQGDQARALVLSGHDDAEPPHPDRYPISQVDFSRVKTPFIIGIWILSASIAKIGFHMTPKLHFIFPESCLLIVVGVAIGVVLYFGTDVNVSPLTPNTFFFYMLPPIILDAGYFMPNRLFFDNLGTILLMAVVGTIFNIATIGGALYACGMGGVFGDEKPKFLDIFLFASLISAVDPVAVLAVFEEIHVNEILYIVVFGESLLNDAVTVVMYHMMEVYNEIGISNIIAQDIVSGVGSFFVVALGGTVIGIIWGVLTGLVTRFTDHVRVIEPIFIFVMAYLAYLNAEIFHMSGILAITFCGITMKNYVESNISQKSHTTVKYALKMLSSSSETIIFMFLGVATVNNMHVWNTWFVILTIVFCSVFRVLGVILLTALANRFRLHKLSRVDQFVMSYGGLRGAVAFALVLLVDERVVKDKNMFVTTTIAVIYFTVFIQGITIKPLVKFLNVKRANKRKPTMNERIHERFMDHLMAGIEDIVGKTGNYNVRDKFKRFDNRFIRPLLIRDLKREYEKQLLDNIPMEKYEQIFEQELKKGTSHFKPNVLPSTSKKKRGSTESTSDYKTPRNSDIRSNSSQNESADQSRKSRSKK